MNATCFMAKGLPKDMLIAKHSTDSDSTHGMPNGFSHLVRAQVRKCLGPGKPGSWSPRDYDCPPWKKNMEIQHGPWKDHSPLPTGGRPRNHVCCREGIWSRQASNLLLPVANCCFCLELGWMGIISDIECIYTLYMYPYDIQSGVQNVKPAWSKT